jgi:hypothetical protein
VDQEKHEMHRYRYGDRDAHGASVLVRMLIDLRHVTEMHL